MKNTLTIVVNIEVTPGMEDRFLNATRRSQAETLREPGCLRYEIYEDIRELNQFVLIEEYNNQEAFEQHKRMPYFEEWKENIHGIAVRRSKILKLI